MNPTTTIEEDMARGAASALSIYMDGELPVEQRDRLLLSLKSDAALRDDWLVYHCIGDALRSEDAVPLTGGFGLRFQSRLEHEPFLFAPEVSKAFAAQRSAAVPRWRMPAAVAAGVAAVVTAGLMVLPQRDTVQTALAPVAAPAGAVASQQPAQAGTQVVAAVAPGAPGVPVAPSAPMAIAPASTAPGPGSPAALPDPALRSVSSEYLMAHRHYSAGLAMRGVVSHVRTAGYDGQ